MNGKLLEAALITGAARAARVFGERAPLLVDTEWCWVDTDTRTLWQVHGGGHLQGTSLKDFSVIEHAHPNASETVVDAVFLAAKARSIVLVLARPSSGVSRVVLVRLEDGHRVELARPKYGSARAMAALDGSAVLVSHSAVEDGALVCFTLRGEKQATIDASWTRERDASEWLPLDHARWWRSCAEGVEEGSFDDGREGGRLIVSDGRAATERSLAVIEGGDEVAIFSRDAERRWIRVVNTDGSLRFEREFAWTSLRCVRARDGYVLFGSRGATLVRTTDDGVEEMPCPGQFVAITDTRWVVREGSGLALVTVGRADERASPEALPIATMALSSDGARAWSVEGGHRLRRYRVGDGAIEHELVLSCAGAERYWIAGLCEGDHAAAIVCRDQWDQSISLWRPEDRASELSEVWSFSMVTQSLVLGVSKDGSRALVNVAERESHGKCLILSRRTGDATSCVVQSSSRPQRACFSGGDARVDLFGEVSTERFEWVRAGEWTGRSLEIGDFRTFNAAGDSLTAHCESTGGYPSVTVTRESAAASYWGNPQQMQRRTVCAIAVAQRCERVAVAIGPGMTLVVLDGEAREVARLDCGPTADEVRALALSDDGRTMVAATAAGRWIVVELDGDERSEP